MLQTNMIETGSGSIEIRDMKPGVPRVALEFIYRNKIDTGFV